MLHHTPCALVGDTAGPGLPQELRAPTVCWGQQEEALTWSITAHTKKASLALKTLGSQRLTYFHPHLEGLLANTNKMCKLSTHEILWKPNLFVHWKWQGWAQQSRLQTAKRPHNATPLQEPAPWHCSRETHKPVLATALSLHA